MSSPTTTTTLNPLTENTEVSSPSLTIPKLSNQQKKEQKIGSSDPFLQNSSSNIDLVGDIPIMSMSIMARNEVDEQPPAVLRVETNDEFDEDEIP